PPSATDTDPMPDRPTPAASGPGLTDPTAPAVTPPHDLTLAKDQSRNLTTTPASALSAPNRVLLPANVLPPETPTDADRRRPPPLTHLPVPSHTPTETPPPCPEGPSPPPPPPSPTRHPPPRAMSRTEGSHWHRPGRTRTAATGPGPAGRERQEHT